MVGPISGKKFISQYQICCGKVQKYALILFVQHSKTCFLLQSNPLCLCIVIYNGYFVVKKYVLNGGIYDFRYTNNFLQFLQNLILHTLIFLNIIVSFSTKEIKIKNVV